MYGIVLQGEIGHHSAEPFALLFMPSRRLDDRIRRLSDQAIGASGSELNVILPKLLVAIHQRLERLRGLAANRFLGGRHPSERRATPP